ncbi:hypothetical protein ACFZDK_43710 [Streptomyces sp. NPDC007901]|uniref:hypothetical protein n=1 Tax=Streptomyces sp. NPDC007901 TaxID=3364785 RepID=UPI0036F09BD3
MKKALASVVAAGIFLAGAGTAFASSWQKLPDLKTRGAAFEQGFYRFNPAERNHGSFEWSGYLIDTDPDDNHNGYVQVRVEGHDWARYYGKQRQRVRLHHSNWDGAQRYTDDAYFRVCLDKGTLRPDNCSSPRHYQPR